MEQKSIIVEATMENLDTVIGFVEEQLELYGCPMKIMMQISVSLEEVYVNVVNYAYGTSTGICEVILKLEGDEAGKSMTLIVKDNGVEFNPLDKEDPDITLSAEERQIGGLGIYMVKKTMDEVSYEYNSGCNILSMVKGW